MIFLWGFRTPIGRGRAWLYLAVMQKKLADYLKVLLDHKCLLRYFGFFFNNIYYCAEREGVKLDLEVSLDQSCQVKNRNGLFPLPVTLLQTEKCCCN